MSPESLDPPVRVDWLHSNLLGRKGTGRLGMTILPGKHGPSLRYPGRIYQRQLDADLRALRSAGVRRLILLVEDAELERWGDPKLVERAAVIGIDVVRAPIPDGRAPQDLAEMDLIQADVNDGRASGDVAVACMGGVGRSGLVAACALVAGGMPPEEAIAAVRAARHRQAVETPEQRRFVTAYAKHRGPADARRELQAGIRAASST